MAALTICSDFGAQKKKVSHCFHCFPIYLLWSDGTRCHDLSFWMFSFKPTFSLSSFTFIKRIFSSFSLSAIRVMSCAYLRLLIFLPAILIPACASSSPESLMMYSAYKLNKQGDNIQPWRTPFPIWKQSVVLCPVLTVASWSAYRFLKREYQVVWYSQLFQNFPQFIVIHTVKSFEMARVKFDILGISELKWTGMGEFNSDDHYIYYCGQDSLRRNGVAIMVNKRVWNLILKSC